jgi:hypothetical protein
LRYGPTRESFGPVLRYTVPIFTETESAGAERGALIVELKLDTLFDTAASSVVESSQAAPSDSIASPRLVVILDRTGNALYHSNVARKYQPAATALPASFQPITEAMIEGRDGWRFYDSPEGDKWLAAYQPLAPLNLSVAVAGD